MINCNMWRYIYIQNGTKSGQRSEFGTIQHPKRPRNFPGTVCQNSGLCRKNRAGWSLVTLLLLLLLLLKMKKIIVTFHVKNVTGALNIVTRNVTDGPKHSIIHPSRYGVPGCCLCKNFGILNAKSCILMHFWTIKWYHERLQKYGFILVQHVYPSTLSSVRAGVIPNYIISPRLQAHTGKWQKSPEKFTVEKDENKSKSNCNRLYIDDCAKSGVEGT